MTLAFAFPGQGSQKPGMARDFHDAFATSRRTFEEASAALGLDLARICFDDDERLGLTEFQQPAILTTEIAMVRALASEFGLTAGAFAGHSLGEYAALVAAGAIPFAEAVCLVRARGRLMQRAVAPGAGAMVALVHRGFDPSALAPCLNALDVDVANENSPTQLVLSGAAQDIDVAVERIRASEDLGRVKAIPLRVSAPFHSRLMKPIEREFRALLEASVASWDGAAATAVASNFTGGFHTAEPSEILDALVRQIGATVRWTDNMRSIGGAADRVIEVGPGRPLRAFFGALAIDAVSVTDVASAEAAVA